MRSPASIHEAVATPWPFGALRMHSFGAILADPPFHFRVRSAKGEGRSASKHYRTMTFDEIAALPVRELAADNCWLFLWTPTPMLPWGLDLISAWGFKYSGTAFCWVKLNKSGKGFFTGLGFTTRKNIELCLLGRRGSPRRNARDVHELILAPRREHSRKPDEQYERIVRFCNGPYLELFARSHHSRFCGVG
jgi:N6-adenosine-specific RNA methylase IME4